MMQPSEIVAAKILPVIRAQLAQILLKEYKMKQVEVAKRMGITQAAVSHYNTRNRAADREILDLFPEISIGVKEIAAKIERGLSMPEQVAAISSLCSEITRTERFCEFHQRFSSLDRACQVCFSNEA